MNQPLQARAGQNAPYPWGPFAHTRGRLAEALILKGDGSDQVLMEGVCLPGIDPGSIPTLGTTLGIDAAVAGVAVLQDDAGDRWPPVAVVGSGAGSVTPVGIAGIPFNGFLGAFLLAEGEKLIGQALGGAGTAKFYPNAGLIPNDPSELKAYRIDLGSGRRLIAEAPPGKALCQVVTTIQAGSPIIYYGVITRNDSAGAPAVQMYLDGVAFGGLQLLTAGSPTALGITPIILDAGGRFTLASGSKLEAEVTGLVGTPRIRWCSSMRMENGS